MDKSLWNKLQHYFYLIEAGLFGKIVAGFSDIQEVIDKNSVLGPTNFFCKGIFSGVEMTESRGQFLNGWYLFSPYLVVNFLPLNGIPISPWKWLVHRNFTGVLLSTHSRRLAISLWLLLCRHQNCLFSGTCADSKIYPSPSIVHFGLSC